jgi:hypothetical protein
MTSPDDVVLIDARRCELEWGLFRLSVDRLSGGQLVSFYLMASYLYYREDVGLFEDSEFDKLCVRLDSDWDSIEHIHKHLIEREALSATTGFYISKYPNSVIGAAHSLYNKRVGITRR